MLWRACFGLALGLLCIGSPEPIERNPFNCVRLSSVSEHNRTQSHGLSSIEFDLFDWIRFVRKLNSLKVWCSISFDCRTQSNSIHGLSSIEFDFRTFDLLCRDFWSARFSKRTNPPLITLLPQLLHRSKADILKFLEVYSLRNFIKSITKHLFWVSFASGNSK